MRGGRADDILMTDYAAITIGLLGAGVCLLVLWRGQTASRRAADEATDDSTGLPNRRRFDLDVEAHARRGGEPTAILRIDVDPLGARNRTREHDDVLRTVGAVLAMMIRTGDVAYRYSGRGFSVLLPATDSAAAWRVAERIRSSIESAALQADGRVTISAGVAAGPAEDAASLVGRAGDALRASRVDGPNHGPVA